MDISVVVPTFNRREMVKRTITSLFAQHFPTAKYEVIAVVDGSTDGSAEALHGLNAPCRFRVVEQENRGLAGARNTGARVAEGELLLFLDDDMLCDPGLVAAHVEAHGQESRRIGFGCILLSPDSPPSLAAECFNREFGAFYLKKKANPRNEDTAMQCVFGNSSLPRALLMEAGGFDESFRMREDLELGHRLFKMGALSCYVERAVAYQYYSKTSADLIRDSEAFAVADVMFARKHPEEKSRGQLNLLSKAPQWKRTLRRIAAVSPAGVDLVLAPVCRLGQTFIHISALRNLGVRALQIRRRIHWLHKVLTLGI